MFDYTKGFKPYKTSLQSRSSYDSNRRWSQRNWNWMRKLANPQQIRFNNAGQQYFPQMHSFGTGNPRLSAFSRQNRMKLRRHRHAMMFRAGLPCFDNNPAMFLEWCRPDYDDAEV